MPDLWSPVDVGRLRLRHRLALSPMMCNRGRPDGSPTALDVEYFAQRASLGLLITGDTQPSADGQGFLLSHGCYIDEHAAGRRRVNRTVHDAGGHLFVQLVHAGRVAHPANTPHGNRAVPTTELSTTEIRATVDDFRALPAAAVGAGADDVENHAANGFLPPQFLSANANHRSDAYAGRSPTARGSLSRSSRRPPGRSARTARRCGFPRARAGSASTKVCRGPRRTAPSCAYSPASRSCT
ncbi:hypothetical protein I6J71_29005 [Amycolatopsis sp. FDAARGOS 1241]|nr:hypothetical protein I6J71_29005 [Amycolatopsis sp. FDAARGOS 1241]